MLHEFLTANRQTLIARCREKVARRRPRRPRDLKMQHGIPLFLEQLVKTLRLEETSNPSASLQVSGPENPAKTPVSSEIGISAAKHGSELLRQGFTVDQVVHDYGDLCQAITELAVEHDTPVKTEEFHTLNRCLDNAIADAVTEFGRRRDSLISTDGAHATGTRLGYLAHDLRNLIDCAMVAAAAIKSGEVGVAGATGALLERSLAGLRHIVDRSLADVRLSVGMPVQHERIELAEFIAEVEISGHLQADARGCSFEVSAIEPGLAVYADRQMLASAVANLLHNAFGFTRADSHVSLKASSADDRLLIEIEDECGGIPREAFAKLKHSLEHLADDRIGLGGLAIAQRSVEANGGAIHLRDLPGKGCVFVIDLPMRPGPASAT